MATVHYKVCDRCGKKETEGTAFCPGDKITEVIVKIQKFSVVDEDPFIKACTLDMCDTCIKDVQDFINGLKKGSDE